MFTSMPTLAERLSRLIDETPIIDPLSQVRVNRPHAADLLSLLSCDWVQTGLLAVGMPQDFLDPDLPPDEIVSRLVPYLARLKNTSVSWCLSRIFRDLFDHFDPLPTRSLCDAVDLAALDPNRGWDILRDRCQMQTFVTNDGKNSNIEDPRFARFAVDLSCIFCPGDPVKSTSFLSNGTPQKQYVDVLEWTVENRSGTASELKRDLFDRLDRLVAGRIRLMNTSIPIDHRFSQVDDSRIDRILLVSRSGRALDSSETDDLAAFVTWNVLAWHHENRKAIRIALGSEPLFEGRGVPHRQETWMNEMASVFERFPNARFDLTIASNLLAHEVALLAGRLPNVYASGYGSPHFLPILIEQILTSRIQIVPMTKFSAFFSNAQSAEWTYGTLKIVKKSMATALARQVEERLLDEDDLPVLLKQILHDTPRDLYDLS